MGTTNHMLELASTLNGVNKSLTDKLEVANAEIRALKCVLNGSKGLITNGSGSTSADDGGNETRKVGA